MEMQAIQIPMESSNIETLENSLEFQLAIDCCALWILKDDAHFGDKIVMFEPFRKAFSIISQEIIGVSHKSQLLI